MQRLAPVWAFLAGAVLMGAAWLLLAEPRPSALDQPEASPAGLADAASVEQRLTRIEDRLEALLVAVGERPREEAIPGPGLAVRTLDPQAPDEVPSGPAAATPIITDEVLEKTLERMTDKKYAKLTTEQMRAEAKRLTTQLKDHNAARDVLTRLLKRDLPAEDRALALTDLGGVHRRLADYPASERVFKDAMRTAGMDTETGIKAGYNLVWTYHTAKQPDKAMGLADELIGNRHAPETFRPWLRWAGARMAYERGDTTRAMRDYSALLEEAKGNRALQSIARDAAAKLKAMDEGPR